MALSLNPLSATVGNLIPDSAWIYYISKAGFINLFPYVHSESFRLREEEMDKACFANATPALNPDKSLFWTPLYMDAGGLGFMTTIGKPIYHDREFKGAVALDMTLEHLDDLIIDVKGYDGSAFIINNHNQLLSSSAISVINSEKIIEATTLLSKEILGVTESSETFIELEDYFLYKKRLDNAPWDFIYYFKKLELYQVVFIKVLPGVLVFIFMIYGRALIEKLTSTQKELERLNNSLEEKVEEKLNELEIQKSTYETLFERSGSGICILKKAKIVDCNDTFVEMLGLSGKEELIGRYILEFAPWTLIKQGDHTWEWRFLRKNGDLLWMDIVSKIIHINGEKVVQVIFKDISKRKQLEKENKEQMNQLLQQSRMAQMGEMLSMISHQWRQPLSSIGMVAMNLEVKISSGKLRENSEDERDAFLLEKVGRIEKYVHYLATTIDDFRNFFQPQKERQKFVVGLLLDETIELIIPTLESRRITIQREYQANQNIFSYENEIKQVILNIVNNAKDALVEKEVQNPLIMIRTYDRGENVVCEIEDNGGGISEAYMSKIFDPYFSTKSKNGTGLGLYMSKTIIEEHCKGTLGVKNSENGALFTITLPLS